MAEGVEIQVDATRALAKLDPATGIPEQVRKNLRTLIPDLTSRLGAAVDANLNTRLKTRKTIAVRKEMVESKTQIVGRVRVIANPPSPAFLPQILETGARAHYITPRNAPYLWFYWDRMERWVRTKLVRHPGFGGTNAASDAFADMESLIVRNLEDSVFGAVRGER